MKKSLISAIKKLLAKLGAEEVEGNNLVEVIDSGADAIEGGGGSGGGGVMQVIATSGTSDKTLGELLTAYDAGTTIIVSYVSDGVTCKGTVIGAAGVYVDSKENYNGHVTVARGETKAGVSLTPFLLSITPTASEADALAAYPTIQ